MKKLSMPDRMFKAGKILTLLPLCLLLLLPLSASAADKLVVKDAEGNLKFVVADDGTVTANKGTLGTYATTARSTRAFNLVDDAGGIRLWRIHDLYQPFFELIYSKPSAPDTIISYWDIFAGLTSGVNMFAIRDRVNNNAIRLSIGNNGYVGIGTGSLPASYPLQIGNGAYVSSGGAWINASSRDFKKDIRELSAEEAFSTLQDLNPVRFSYKTGEGDSHVGFIAEDVPALVAVKDRKGLSSMDIVAVLTKVIQEQQKTIIDLSAKIAVIEREGIHSDSKGFSLIQ
jgi:hypothetical protein